MTSYLQKKFSSFFSNIYGGVDFERFSTFNLEEIIDGSETTIAIKTNQILYVTGGIGLKFSIFSPINIKVSMSKGVVATGKFNGTKFLFYMNQKLGKKFWYHIIYKQHVLSGGKSDLTVGRLGVGLGMSLF